MKSADAVAAFELADEAEAGWRKALDERRELLEALECVLSMHCQPTDPPTYVDHCGAMQMARETFDRLR